MNVNAMSSAKHSTEDELRGLLEDSHGAYAALTSDVLQKMREIDALTKRAEAADQQLAAIPVVPLRRFVEAILLHGQPLQFDIDAAQKWLDGTPIAAEARQWQYAGVPCDNCGNDSTRVICDSINKDSGIERRIYHCPECNRAWVKVRVTRGG